MEVAKDAKSLLSGIAIQFNNLYFHDTLLPIHHDTLILNDKKFTNYYLFESSLTPKRPDDVKILYMNLAKGFFGFKTLSGELWIRED